jgi:hypothetical protein
MRVLACIFAILSGIFGLFGGSAQGIFGAGLSMLTKSDGTMNNGIIVFFLSWLIIILGGMSLKFPHFSGICLIIISIAAFSLGNIFSAPFAFLAGIFDLFAESVKSNLDIRENPESRIQVTDNESIYTTKKISVLDLDKSSLLNQLSQLYDLKRKEGNNRRDI